MTVERQRGPRQDLRYDPWPRRRVLRCHGARAEAGLGADRRRPRVSVIRSEVADVRRSLARPRGATVRCRTREERRRRCRTVRHVGAECSGEGGRQPRKPYDFGSNRASHSGSSALTTRAWSTRSRMTGMPSGRFLAPALGMCTRLTGRGVQAEERYCAQLTRSVFDWGSSAVRPSTPAVLRPALISVTRRTLSSVLARERSISFCRLRTRLRSPAWP